MSSIKFEYPEKQTLLTDFELDLSLMILNLFSFFLLLTAILRLLECPMVVPKNNRSSWKFTTIFFPLITDVVSTSWTLPEMCWLCICILLIHRVQFDSRHLREKFCQSMRPHEGCGRPSPCLVSVSLHAWPYYWYEPSSLKKSQFFTLLSLPHHWR